jgi:predicted small lipoprotein YifL
MLLTCVLVLAGCGQKQPQTKIPKGESSDLTISTQYHKDQQNVDLLHSFLKDSMIQKAGIYTNFKDDQNKDDVATGHDMLSESSGLWLEYLAQTHQNQAFRDFYKNTKKYFDQGRQFSYRIDGKTKKKSNVNATLDDLRIIRALQIYAQNTNSKKYHREAATRFAMLQTTSIQKDRVLDFYDVHTKKASSKSSLAYYDLATLKYFESVSKKERGYYQKQLKLVQKGYLGDIFPLYAPSFDWKTEQYGTENLNTSEALITVLHLAEIGKMKPETLSWLKMQIDNKKLYNSYTTAGAIANHDQSTGNYALVAMIFAKNDNQEYYQKAMDLVWKSQVQSKKSKIYGALGDAKSNDAYSFNNLLALLTSQY